MFRSSSRMGFWMAGLLPLALSSDPVNLIALSTSIYSIFYTIEGSQDTSVQSASNDHPKVRFIQGDNKAVWILTLVIALLTSSSLTSMVMYTVAFLTFVYILPKIFLTFRASFSYGEGVLVLQSTIIFIVKLISNTIQEVHDPSTVEGSFYIIANAGLGSVFGLCLLYYSPLKLFQYHSTFYVTGFSMLFGITVPYLYLTLKRNPISWMFQVIFADSELRLLFLLWGVCTILAFHIVSKQCSKASTITRKYFHFLVVIVHTSGVLVNRTLLYLASIVGLSVMILLEHMRFANIPPVANFINSAFKTFQNKNDQGDLILTNIYLLVGVSLPLWLTPDLENADPLLLLSGVLSIGIGDSFASIIGSKFGRWRIPRTLKSVEGLIASVITQLLFVKALQMDLTPTLILGTITVSLIEAFTTQVDNLALPFVMFVIMKNVGL